MTSFILVLQPHQRPGDSYVFKSDQQLIDAWANGMFKQWNADNFHEIDGRDATLDDAINDIGHDLHALTFITSKEECKDYLSRKYKVHNFPFQSVSDAARKLGWIDE